MVLRIRGEGRSQMLEPILFWPELIFPACFQAHRTQSTTHSDLASPSVYKRRSGSTPTIIRRPWRKGGVQSRSSSLERVVAQPGAGSSRNHAPSSRRRQGVAKGRRRMGREAQTILVCPTTPFPESKESIVYSTRMITCRKKTVIDAKKYL